MLSRRETNRRKRRLRNNVALMMVNSELKKRVCTQLPTQNGGATAETMSDSGEISGNLSSDVEDTDAYASTPYSPMDREWNNTSESNSDNDSNNNSMSESASVESKETTTVRSDQESLADGISSDIVDIGVQDTSLDTEDNVATISDVDIDASLTSESEIDTDTEEVFSEPSFDPKDGTTNIQDFTDHTHSVALLSLVSKHKATDSCTADVLRLFSTMVPCNNPFPPTLYLLIKRFLRYEEEIIVHHCCGCCAKLLQNNQVCKSVVCKASGIPSSSFIKVRLDRQLQTLFSGTHTHNTQHTTHTHTHKHTHTHNTYTQTHTTHTHKHTHTNKHTTHTHKLMHIAVQCTVTMYIVILFVKL